jgi:hypothetical protein
MGLQKNTAGSSLKPSIWVEYSAKAGAFVSGYKDTREEFDSVTGEIVDMFIMDPTKPKTGAPKENAKEIPIKLYVTIKDGDDRINVGFPLHTTADKAIGFSAMNAVGSLYGTLMHHFVEKQNKRPNAIRLGAGTTSTTGGSWMYGYGQDENGEFPITRRIARAWGVKEDGTLNLGVEKQIGDKTVLDAPEGFVGTYTQGPAAGTQYIDTNKVMALVADMVQPFEEAKAQRAQARNAEHDHEAGAIDPGAVDEARDSLRQRDRG